MKKPKLLSWKDALLNLERIPELIKFLVLDGQNHQLILNNEELRHLILSHRFAPDFIPDLVQYNYRNLYFLWSQQGVFSLPNLILRMEAKTQWHPNSWKAYLSPVEIHALQEVAEHTNVNLDYLYQGLTGAADKEPQVRFINFFKQLQSKISLEFSVLAPFEDEDFRMSPLSNQSN